MDWKRPYATKTARHGHVIKYGEWVSGERTIYLDEFLECSDRSKTSIQKVKIILDNIPQEVNFDHFDEFAEEMMDVLRRISSHNFSSFFKF